MKYRLILEDDKYNRFGFEFTTMGALSGFLETAFYSSVRELKATIEIVTGEESEEENDI